MKSIDAFTKMIEDAPLRKNRIAEGVGTTPQALNSSLHAKKGIGADKLAAYAEVCGYTLAIVPSEYAKFLPEQAIVIDNGGQEEV